MTDQTVVKEKAEKVVTYRPENPIMSQDVVVNVFGKMLTNADGTSSLDDDIVVQYLSYFPSINMRYNPTTQKLVPAATVPNMTCFVDGDDNRKRMMTSYVKEADLFILGEEGNTKYYDIRELYDVISGVPRRGDGSGISITGKMVLRQTYLEQALEIVQDGLNQLLIALGDDAYNFPQLFTDGDSAISLVELVKEAYAKADAEFAAKKEEAELAKAEKATE